MRFRHFTRFSLAILSLLLIACDATATFPLPDSNAVMDILMKRADQITKLHWTPLAQVPTQGGYFSQGRVVIGIPYSSVKEKEMFVGQYVSCYTFMTAVSNPKSVLYTENVKEPPYHGTNCSTFYGTVCSMAVNYVLGLPYSYTTSNYKNLPCFEMVNPQDIEYAQPGDILLQDKKHVVIILDIARTKDDVGIVSILESSGGKGTRVDTYTKKKLLERWERDGWELLRYKGLDKIAEIESMRFNDYPYDTPFNSPLCCSRGDRAAFAVGEKVVLNNLDGKAHRIIIIRDGVDEGAIETDGSDVSFSARTPGIYTFDLSNTTWNNPTVEVIDATVSVGRNGDSLFVHFSSANAKPMSMIISNINGSHYLVEPIDDSEREAGTKILKIPNHSGQLYLKVMFEGQYGSVMNEPILIQ